MRTLTLTLLTLTLVLALTLPTPTRAEEESRSMSLPRHKFAELSRDSQPFGFLPGGTAEVEIRYNPGDMPLVFLMCTDSQLARLNREYGSVSALCEAGPDVPCDLAAGLGNGTYALANTFTKQGVYYALLGNCGNVGVSVSFSYTFLNPGGEQLSFGDIPRPKMYTYLALLWGLVLLAWGANRALYFRSPIKLHAVLGAAAAAKLTYTVTAALHWSHLSRYGEPDADIEFAHNAALVGDNAAYYALLFLYAKGWCISVVDLYQQDLRLFGATSFVLAATTAFDAYYHGGYLFIVIIVYVVLGRLLFTSVAENISTIRAQLWSIHQADIDPLTTPVHAKLLLFATLQKGLIYFIISLVALSIANVFFLSHYAWVSAAITQGAQLAFFIVMFYALRLRNFSRYESTPPQSSSSPQSAPSSSSMPSSLTSRHPALFGAGGGSLTGVLTRSPHAPPRRRNPGGELRPWTPGMALPNTPEFAMEPPEEPNPVSIVVYPSCTHTLRQRQHQRQQQSVDADHADDEVDEEGGMVYSPADLGLGIALERGDYDEPPPL